jgi:hypothetical protein
MTGRHLDWLDAQQSLIDLVRRCSHAAKENSSPDWGLSSLAYLLGRLEACHPALAGAMYTMCIPVFAKDGQEDGRVKARLASWAISGLNHRKTAGRIAAYMEHFREDLDESFRDIPTAMRRLKADMDCIARVTLSASCWGGYTWRYIQQHAAQVNRGSSADDVVIGVSALSPPVAVPRQPWVSTDNGPMQLGPQQFWPWKSGQVASTMAPRPVQLDSPVGDEPNTAPNQNAPSHGG